MPEPELVCMHTSEHMSNTIAHTLLSEALQWIGLRQGLDISTLLKVPPGDSNTWLGLNQPMVIQVIHVVKWYA